VKHNDILISLHLKVFQLFVSLVEASIRVWQTFLKRSLEKEFQIFLSSAIKAAKTEFLKFS